MSVWVQWSQYLSLNLSKVHTTQYKDIKETQH